MYKVGQISGISETKGFTYRIHKVSRNAKVTHFDTSFTVDEDIGWLDITMYHL